MMDGMEGDGRGFLTSPGGQDASNEADSRKNP